MTKTLFLVFTGVALAWGQNRSLVVVPAASFDGNAGLASDSIAAAFGDGLAPSTVVSSTTTLLTQLGGTNVNVVDSRGVSWPAPLFAVSPGQVNFLVPAGTAPTTSRIRKARAYPAATTFAFTSRAKSFN